MFPYVESYDGYAVRQLMIDNVDILGYLSFIYLAFVWKGPALVRRLNGESMRISSSPLLTFLFIVWNFILSSFSFFGMIVVVPALVQNAYHKGFMHAICDKNDNMIYSSYVGFWIGMFVLSKVPELVDTILLILQGKQPPFLHWYHHVTVLVFSWHTYYDGVSTMIIFAAMNLTVHFIMYFYFAMCACGFKKTMRKVAPLITMMQILQMVVGTGVTGYSLYSVYLIPAEAESGQRCHVSKSSARMGFLMYVSYLYLFSVMFVNSYLTPKKRTAGTGAVLDNGKAKMA
ncbi:fatty acid elongase [Trypanosoma theileri]|uniref:Elongation of fatty acids protein n=1 Tax=Trypanosoma theileri TaxID=67003 RepID=A0A1X0NNM4_9TRYP|nr:fatty acid elongase [Trypanosoma theileri]ORC86305.1 fatty acid elongase [Trypanosoma theileri]